MLRKVATRSDLFARPGKVVIVDDRAIALFRVGGRFYAISNTCPHRGGSLGAGEVNGHIVTCPWHGWQFDCRSGEAVENRAVRVQSYPVHVIGEDIYIEWPSVESVTP
ncbi:MAG: Rieske (2Fe-2S) protein [Fidelibacterota bacterium]